MIQNLKKIKKYMLKPSLLVLKLNKCGFFKGLNDSRALHLIYKLKTGKKLNLEDPQTFNEKIQWLKLNDRNDIYTTMVDKYEVKKYVSNIIGEEYIIPTLGVYSNFDEINFDVLPQSFVIKCTHDSGGLVIVKDKDKFNKKKARKMITKLLNKNFYYRGREWPYKNVKPRIIIEKFMSNNGKELFDYKIHNFNGTPKFILVCKDRHKETGLTEDFFDIDWNHLNIRRPSHDNSKEKIAKPKKLNEMINLSKKLSKNIPFVRTDFYITDNRIYFGEITFYPASGFENFVPDEYDKIFGDMLVLPDVRKE